MLTRPSMRDGTCTNIATSPVFNLIFFALLITFAFSFMGAFELVLPASWTNKMDSKVDSTTGFISLFFMAFTLALVSFSCTGPIIGWLLVDAATHGNFLAPALGMFGFAFALAIPFTLFAVFPSWLKTLPKSGSWLNSVKVVLGFIVLAVSLKFLSVADLSGGWGILQRDVFLALWIVIFGPHKISSWRTIQWTLSSMITRPVWPTRHEQESRCCWSLAATAA